MAYHPVETVVRPYDGHQFEVTKAGDVVAGLLIDHDSMVFVMQWRAGAGKPMIEAVAGRVDAGETPKEAFVRESCEEAELFPSKVVSLGTVFLSPGWTDERCHLFAGTLLSPRKQSADPDEKIDIIRLPLHTSLMAFEDAKTALLLTVARELGLLPVDTAARLYYSSQMEA